MYIVSEWDYALCPRRWKRLKLRLWLRRLRLRLRLWLRRLCYAGTGILFHSPCKSAIPLCIHPISLLRYSIDILLPFVPHHFTIFNHHTSILYYTILYHIWNIKVFNPIKLLSVYLYFLFNHSLFMI